MKKTDVLNFFGGTAATAVALNIKSPSVSGWGEDVPELRAYQIERLTRGELKVNPVIVLDNPKSVNVA
jgi:DNA-binding transcriptional regulator YdaS (Cro superfamily)